MLFSIFRKKRVKSSEAFEHIHAFLQIGNRKGNDYKTGPAYKNLITISSACCYLAAAASMAI
jgi:hypothetical protein